MNEGINYMPFGPTQPFIFRDQPVIIIEMWKFKNVFYFLKIGVVELCSSFNLGTMLLWNFSRVLQANVLLLLFLDIALRIWLIFDVDDRMILSPSLIRLVCTIKLSTCQYTGKIVVNSEARLQY